MAEETMGQPNQRQMEKGKILKLLKRITHFLSALLFFPPPKWLFFNSVAIYLLIFHRCIYLIFHVDKQVQRLSAEPSGIFGNLGSYFG